MILRHESALDGAIQCKVKVVLSLRKEFPTGNVWVTATAQDDDTWMADIGKVLGIDNLSCDSGYEQV
jgi:hypothetical protein